MSCLAEALQLNAKAVKVGLAVSCTSTHMLKQLFSLFAVTPAFKKTGVPVCYDSMIELIGLVCL